MVGIGIKGAMITAKNNLKIRTRNYADWKLLKNGCRESLPCDDSDNEDTFDPNAVPADNSGESLQGPEQTATLVKSSPEQTATRAKMKVGRAQSSPDQSLTQNKDLRPVTGPEGNNVYKEHFYKEH